MCNSQTTANDLCSFYPSTIDKITVTHLSHDSCFRHLNTDEIENIMTENFILYVGKRGYYKDFKTLLLAYAGWSLRNNVKLYIVGPNLSEEERKQIVSLGLMNSIRFFEHPDDKVLCNLYNQALAFIQPSLYEGFGVTLLEAMACGCPVIASRIPSTLEVAQSAPIYFEAGDPGSLLEALNFVIENSADIKEHVSNGYHVASQYSWEKTAKKIYSVIEELDE